MKNLLIAILLAIPLFSYTQKSCIGCSTSKDQWIWDACYSPFTQNAWNLTGINPNPNSSLKVGQGIVFFRPDNENLTIDFTKPATREINSPWLLVGNRYDEIQAEKYLPMKPETVAIKEPKVKNSSRFSLGFVAGLLSLILFLAFVVGFALYHFFKVLAKLSTNNRQEKRQKEANRRGQQIANGNDPAFVGPMVNSDGINDLTAGGNLAISYPQFKFLGIWHHAEIKFLTPVSFLYEDNVASSPSIPKHEVECYVGKFENDGEVLWLPSVRRCGNGLYLTEGQMPPVIGTDFVVTKVLEGEGWEDLLITNLKACRDLGVEPPKSNAEMAKLLEVQSN